MIHQFNSIGFLKINRLALVLFLSMIVGAAGLGKEGRFRIPCFVQAVTESSAVVCWETYQSLDAVFVYGTDTLFGTSLPTSTELRNEIVMPGLQQGVKYFYNLTIDGRPILQPLSEYFVYTCPNLGESFTFAVLGDTRGGSESFDMDHRAVVASIAQYTIPDFLIHTGDLLEHTVQGAWERFFDVESILLRQSPIYPVRGNTEGTGVQFASQFHLPGNELWYSFRYGPVFFVALDVQNRKTLGYYQNHIGIRSPQYQWLKEELRSAHRESADFTIAFFHAPLFPPDGKGEPFLQETLCPLLENHGVDLVLNGQHYFSYAHRNGVTYIISGGGGASLDKAQKVRSKHVRVYRPLFHHLRIRYHEPALLIEAVDNFGTVFFTHSLIATEGGKAKFRAQEIPLTDVDGNADLAVRIFGTKGCHDCKDLQERIFPQIQASLDDIALDVRFVDVDDPEQYQQYLAIESKAGDKKASFPVVIIGEELLAGRELEPLRLMQSIRLYLSQNHTKGNVGRHPVVVFVVLAGALVLIIAGVLRGLQRHSKNKGSS